MQLPWSGDLKSDCRKNEGPERQAQAPLIRKEGLGRLTQR